MPGETVDGNDLIAVHTSAAKAINRARSGKGPTLLEYKTYRWRGHHAGEAMDGLLYRSKKEVEKWKKKDPIKRFQELMLKENTITQSDIKDLDQQINQEMDEAFKFADSSPYPATEFFNKNVFVERNST
jgi:pyruvate dehydrogenase E1 component alpha subunit